MSTTVYESYGTKSTGNFFTESIRKNLAAGKLVVYVDTTRGFAKHGINADQHQQNLCIIDSADLKEILPTVLSVLRHIDGRMDMVVYLDHLEHTQADIEQPMIQHRSTMVYRRKLLAVLNQDGVTVHITNILNERLGATQERPAEYLGLCQVVRLDNFETPLKG